MDTAEFRVLAVELHQFGVATRLDDAALVQDVEAVGSLEGADAVRDEDRGTTSSGGRDRLLNLMLGFGIDGGSRVVE